MGWYFEEFALGREVVTVRRTLTESDVATFSGLSGDFNPLHTDEIFATEAGFGGRIAHGPMVLGMALGLGARAGLFDGTVLGMLGVEWTFLAAVRPGDTLGATIAVMDARESRKPDRGIVGLRFEIHNQHQVLVQRGYTKILFKRKPATQPTQA